MNQVNPSKPKTKRAPKKNGDAIALPHLVQTNNWFNENGVPQPYILALAFCFHIVLLYFFTIIEPIIIKNDKAIKVEIIEFKEEKIEEIKKQVALKPPPKIAEKQIPLKEIKQEIKPIIKPEIEPVLEKIQPEIEEIKPNEVKNLIIETKQIEKLKSPNLSKMEKIESKLEIPEQIEDFKLEEKPIKDISIIKENAKIFNKSTIQNQKIDSKIEIPEQIEDFKLEEKPIKDVTINNNKIINSQNLSKNLPKIDSKINVTDEDELKEKKQQEIDKQKQIKEINNAPIDKNGELPKPSGITSLGGNGSPVINNGGEKTGSGETGILPKRPPNFGAKGKNIFEENGDNGTLIGKVGQSLECAKLGQKERSEKCPNWQPLEGNIGLKLPPKAPNNIKPATGIKEPLPPCPPNSPHANLGVKCIVAPLTKKQ